MSGKRNFSGEEEDNNRRSKRICSSYPNGSHSVSVKLTLNQLLNSSANKSNGTDDQTSDLDKKCFNCRLNCQSVCISCNFCERSVCDDCSLNCCKCMETYCRLCAVKCYQFSDQNNAGICLSCSS